MNKFMLVEVEGRRGSTKEEILYDLAISLNYKLVKCVHDWDYIWLTEDMEGYRCKNCKMEALEIYE